MSTGSMVIIMSPKVSEMASTVFQQCLDYLDTCMYHQATVSGDMHIKHSSTQGIEIRLVCMLHLHL